MRISNMYKLISIIIILLTIYSCMIFITKNLYSDKNFKIKIYDIEKLDRIVDKPLHVPNIVVDNCEIEMYTHLSTLHIINDKAELMIELNKEQPFDYFSFSDKQYGKGIIREHNIESSMYNNLVIRDILGDYGSVTLVSYDSYNIEYGMIILGKPSNKEIEEILNDVLYQTNRENIKSYYSDDATSYAKYEVHQ